MRAGPTAWLHLLPEGATLEPHELPDEVRALVEPRIHVPADTLLIWGGSRSNLPNPEAFQAIVLLRPGGTDAGWLPALGFQHVRRFAVVPGLRQARWYLPVGSRQSTTRAWDLYVPGTAAGNVAKFGARLLTRAFGAGCLGEQLIIAQRSRSPLEAALAGVVGTDTFDLAIAVPHAHGQRDRLWLLAITLTGTALAYAKFAYRPQSVGHLQREAVVTRHVRELDLRSIVIPDVLHAAPSGHGYLMVSAPLNPESRPSASSLTPRHLAVLAELARHPGQVSSDTLIRQLGERSQRLACDLPPHWASRLAQAVDVVSSCTALRTLPSALSHGDFVPWNIRQTAGDDRLVVFDWEQGHRSQFLLWDAFHFRAQVDIVLRRVDPHASTEQALRYIGGSSLAQGFRLSYAQSLVLFIAYLTDVSVSWFESHSPPAIWGAEAARTRSQPMRAAMLDAALEMHRTVGRAAEHS